MPDRYDEEARALLADGDDPAMAEARRLMDEPVHVAGPDDAEFERLVKAQHRAHDWSVPGQVNSVQRTEDARDVAGEGTRITEGMAARVVAKRQAKEDAKAIADEHFRRFIAAGDEYKRKGDWDRAGQFNSVEWARRYNENDPDSVEEMRQQVVQMQRGDPVNDISPWRAAIAQGAQVPAQLVNNIIAKVTGTPQRDIAPDMSEALAKDPVAEAVGGLTGGVGSMGLMGPVAKALGGGLKAWTAVGAGAGAASAPEGEELKGALRGGSANFLAAVGAGGLAKVLPGRAYIRLPAAGAAGGTGAEVVVDLATGERITGKRLAHALATNAVFSMNDLPVAARKEAAARFGALRTNLRTEQAASRDLNAYLDSKRPESPLGAAKPVDATQAGTENPTKPPPLSRALTKMEAGEVIAEAVGDGTVPLQDVVSKTVADGLKAGLPVQEALALPRPAGQEGYSPDTSNLDPAVKDLVDRTQAEIGPTVSSGTKPEPWALALDLKTGRPVRVTEKDLAPASPERVVRPDDLPDAEVSKGTTWFHGSGTEGLTPENIDTIGRSEPGGLVGMGLYLTDDAGVAGGYSTARRGKPTVYEARVEPRNVINFERPLPPDVGAKIQELADGMDQTFDTLAGDAVRKALAEGKSGMDVYRAMTDEFSGQVPHSEVVEPLQTLQSDLRSLGYDAITHIGGGRVGKKRHRVLVMLDPTDAGNAGVSHRPVRSFAPTQPDVAAPRPPEKADVHVRGPRGASGDGIDAMSKPGHAYRGMTEAEYEATVGAGLGVRSRGDYSHGSEGTSFGDKADTAESYVNFGRDDPRKTGRPTYMVEVRQGGVLRVDPRDGYIKAPPGTTVPTDQITGVWKMDAVGDKIFARPIRPGADTTPPDAPARGTQPDVAAPRLPEKTPSADIPAPKPAAKGGDFDIDPATGLPNYLSHVKPSKPLKPGPMRRMDNPERGALDTSVVTAPLKGMADEVTTMAARVAKTDPELAKRIVAAPDQARRVAGRLSPAVERVYRAAGAFKEIGANPIGSGAKERKALADFERVPKSDWFKSPMVEQHEGRQAVSGVIPIATQRLSLARWKEAQRLGIMRENPETGVMEPLPDSNGKVFVRFSTPWRVDTMRNPGTANWNKLVRWHAEAEGIPVVEAEALLEAESTSMGLRAGTPLSKEASFEHRRFWKNVPAAGLVDGKVEPIYVTDPVEWAKKMSTEGAQRLGYASVMGQDFYVDSKTGKAVPGRTPVGDMRKDFIAKGGDPEVFDEAVRTAAGRPAIEPGRADTKGASVQRALDRIWHGLTRLRFSAVGLLNPAEPGGLANEQSGLGNTAAAALDAIGSGLYRLTGGRIAEGAFKRVSALVREGATPLERPSSQSYVNRTAAGASKRFVDQMRNGKIIDRARAAARLEATGIDYATARRMAEGKGTAAEYDAYARGATSRATGSGIGAVEKLRVENRGKLMRAAFTPLNYASRNIKQLYGTLKVVATAARSGNPNRIRAALQQTGTFALGRLATGTVQLAVMSLMTGGVQRLKDVIADYEDDTKGVGGRSLLQSMLSGPYGAFLRVTSGDADIGSVVMPVAIGRELVDAFTGGGFYEDMAFGDRMWKLTKSVAPIVKVGDTSVAMMAEAFGNPQHERQFIEAKRALGRWRRKHELAAGTWDRGDEDATFTRSMREVYKKIINKEDPWDAIMAMGKDRESIAASLMSRRALADPMLKGADPASGLSSESYALLKAHDEMLENLAYTVLNKARPAPRAEKVRKMNLPVDPRK